MSVFPPLIFGGGVGFSDLRRGMQAKLRGQIKHTLVFTGTVMHCIKTFQARQTTLRHWSQKIIMDHIHADAGVNKT